ncbi:hypothetical protein HDU76_007187, partial [Blyttiomyces sp. JEL0837]
QLILSVASLVTFNSIAVQAQNFVFYYQSDHVPSPDTRVFFSNLPFDQSQCLKTTDLTKLAPGEKCCSANFQDIGIASGVRVPPPDGQCSFTPSSALLSSPSTWVVSQFGIDMIGYTANGDLNMATSFNLDKGSYSTPLEIDFGNDGGTCPNAPDILGIWSTSIKDMEIGTLQWSGSTAPLVSGTPSGGDTQVTVDPSQTFQKMLGFGFAMTQASAKILLETRDSAGHDQYVRILESLFSPTKGLGATIIRIAIGPCDFSTDGHFLDGTAHNNPSLTPTNLDQMALTTDDRNYVLPVLKDAQAMGFQFKLYTEAWALPWWMMKPGTYFNHFGEFDSAHVNDAATYLLNAAKLWKAEGFDLWGVGMLNEPTMNLYNDNWRDVWKDGNGGGIGIKLYPDDAAAIANIMFPKMRAQGINAHAVGYAHNTDDPRGYVEELLAKTNGNIDVISWHCYNFDQNKVSESLNSWNQKLPSISGQFPNVHHIMGECSGFSQPSTPNYFGTGGGLLNTYIVPINQGSGGAVFWNAVLEAFDSRRSFSGVKGCDTCRGIINSLLADNYKTACITPEWYAMRQYAPFLSESSQRIGLKVNGATDCIMGHAFQTGQTISVILHNVCTGAKSVSVGVRDVSYQLSLNQGSATFEFAKGSGLPQIVSSFNGASNQDICKFSTVDMSCSGDWCGATLKSRWGYNPDVTGSTGLCLDAGQNGNPGAYYCFGENDNQKFNILPERSQSATGYLRITHGGRCLSATSFQNGASVTYQPCTDDLRTYWYFGADPAPGQPYVFMSAANHGFCLDIDHNNVNAQLWQCSGSPSQMFDLLTNGMGYWSNDPVGKKTGCSPFGCWIYFRDRVEWPRQLVLDLRNGNMNGE